MKYLKSQKGLGLISLLIIIIIIVVVIIFISSNENNSEDNISDTTATGSNTIPTLYGLNKELSLIGSDGGQASLTITGIREMSERNEYSDKNYPQVFLIDYTYKNISSSDSMYISDMNFKIVDENGEVGGTYPNDYTFPETLIAGTTCKAQMVFGVNNRSKK